MDMRKKLFILFILFIAMMPSIVLAEFEFCDINQNPEVLAGFRLGGIVITIIKIVVPIILIILGMIDMSKAVIDSNNDAIKKSAIVFGKRAIAAVLIFFVPAIMKSIFESIDSWKDKSGEFNPCLTCLLNVSECPSNAEIVKK